MEQPSLEDTLEFIKKAHDGQSYGGKPYWTHPLAVMKLLPAGSSDDEKTVALMHDVIEDTPITSHDLREMGYGEPVIQAVELLSNNVSKSSEMTYLQWIEQVIAGSGNPIAIKVKYADNKHNLSTTSNLPIDKREGRKKRYTRSMKILSKVMGSK